MTNRIGIAGTAKNTGKTTTLNALLKAPADKPHSVGVTSIGYDGEEIDNITGLPKPRIVPQNGMIASTVGRCLPKKGWTILAETGCESALGPIVIARCDESSPVVLAGPKTRRDLLAVSRQMEEFGAETIFVDGALNRIAPMSVVDRIIVATGAARHTDIPFLVRETKAIEQIFAIPQSGEPVPHNVFSVIYTREDVDSLLNRSANDSVLPVGGLISYEALAHLCERLQSADTISTVLFNDPIMLLLVDAPERTTALLHRLTGAGIALRCRNTITLSAVTVNPFFPEYVGTTYTAKFVDAQLLLRSMKQNLSVPVFNILHGGAWELRQIIRKK